MDVSGASAAVPGAHGKALASMPAEQAATRYVAAMGGIDAGIAQAKTGYDDGDLRWAATLLDRAVFADSANEGVPRRDVGPVHRRA